MAPQAILVLLVVVALPVAWLVSEFGKRRPVRITLGLAAIASAIGVAYLVGHFSHFKYEAKHVWRDLSDNSVWQTDTLHKLIRATPTQLAFTQQPD